MLLYVSIVLSFLPLNFSIPPWIHQHLLIHSLLMTFGLFLFFAIMIETGIDMHVQVFAYAFLFLFCKASVCSSVLCLVTTKSWRDGH